MADTWGPYRLIDRLISSPSDHLSLWRAQREGTPVLLVRLQMRVDDGVMVGREDFDEDCREAMGRTDSSWLTLVETGKLGAQPYAEIESFGLTLGEFLRTPEARAGLPPPKALAVTRAFVSRFRTLRRDGREETAWSARPRHAVMLQPDGALRLVPPFYAVRRQEMPSDLFSLAELEANAEAPELGHCHLVGKLLLSLASPEGDTRAALASLRTQGATGSRVAHAAAQCLGIEPDGAPSDLAGVTQLLSHL